MRFAQTLTLMYTLPELQHLAREDLTLALKYARELAQRKQTCSMCPHKVLKEIIVPGEGEILVCSPKCLTEHILAHGFKEYPPSSEFYEDFHHDIAAEFAGEKLAVLTPADLKEEICAAIALMNSPKGKCHYCNATFLPARLKCRISYTDLDLSSQNWYFCSPSCLAKRVVSWSKG